jgi:AraC-like DNA-binding protein
MVEVAHELGFADQAHFSRVFKRVLGVTPSTYTRSARRHVC